MQVAQFELGAKAESEFSLKRCLDGKLSEKEQKVLRIFKIDQLFAPVASGSNRSDAMVIVPCSMGTLARVAHGMSTNLIERAADVMIKSHKPLVLCPRETPLSTIHLTNMLALARMQVQIVPPIPAFYQKPRSMDDLIDFVVGRLLEALGFEHELYEKWNKRMS